MPNEIAVIEQSTAIEAFNGGKIATILDQIETEVRSIVTDISTEKGRKEIASIARKIASTKVAMDTAGKELKAEAKQKCDAIDEERRKITTRLDALKEEFRKPLTDWETQEEKRVADHEDAIQLLIYPRTIDYNVKIPDEINAMVLANELQYKNRDWQEFGVRATMEFNVTRDLLETTAKRRAKEISDTEELVKLRKEKEENDRKEREDKIAKEAADEATLQANKKAEADALRVANEAEEKRIEQVRATEKAEREKQAEKERADKAESDKKAAEAKAAQDKIDAEKKAEADKAAAVQAERDRQAEETKRQADEAAKREKDTAHKKKINNEALQDMIDALPTDKVATAGEAVKIALTAIAKGNVRHVKISY